jgi:hypothetical protein
MLVLLVKEGIDAATMLIGADLYPCSLHTLSRRHRHQVQTDAPVTIRPLMSILDQRVAHINRSIAPNVGSCSTGLATSELRRMFLQPTPLGRP